MPLIKNNEQIDKIKKACKITDAIFIKIVKYLRKDLRCCTEIQLRDFILEQIKKRGLEPSFPPIVTCGKKAGGEIHPQSTNNKLQGFAIIDFGVIYEKYMSDMTRTIYVACPSLNKGQPPKEEKEIYSLMLKSQELGINIASPDMYCADLDEIVRNSLGKYKKYFIHTLGHGVGTQIHEKPIIYFKNTKDKLKENMIITIEPGIYIKNKYGIRIEDTCQIIKKGCIALTKSTKELIVIE